MARLQTWQKVRYFKPDSHLDNFGDPGAIDDLLLLRLDHFRHWLGIPVYVVSGVKVEGVIDGNFHRMENGTKAVDVVIPEYQEGPLDLVLDATRFGFTGIGYYPDWVWEGEVVGGLHLDVRPVVWTMDEMENFNQCRWIGLEDGSKIPMDSVSLKDHNQRREYGSEV